MIFGFLGRLLFGGGGGDPDPYQIPKTNVIVLQENRSIEVLAENRLLLVDSENRIFKVLAENRVVAVDAENRILIVLNESRIVRATQ